MDIKDLAGLSEPLKKLIEVVSQGIGALSRPYLIRKTADAKAYEIKTITQAVRDNQQNLKHIGFDDEKGEAEVLVKTRRREAINTTDNISKVFNQDITITFKKENEIWRVDSANWTAALD